MIDISRSHHEAYHNQYGVCSIVIETESDSVIIHGPEDIERVAIVPKEELTVIDSEDHPELEENDLTLIDFAVPYLNTSGAKIMVIAIEHHDNGEDEILAGRKNMMPEEVLDVLRTTYDLFRNKFFPPLPGN